jgi:hypothetical protein
VSRRENVVSLDCRLLESERECGALRDENERLGELLDEVVALIRGGASEERLRAFADKVERS